MYKSYAVMAAIELGPKNCSLSKKITPMVHQPRELAYCSLLYSVSETGDIWTSLSSGMGDATFDYIHFLCDSFIVSSHTFFRISYHWKLPIAVTIACLMHSDAVV